MTAASAKFNYKNYLHPRHWPTWLGIGLMRISVMLPYAALLFIGRRLGDFMRMFEPRRRQITTINLELCFPELDAASRDRLLRQTFHAVGISLMESALSWWASDARLKKLYRMEGEEHLHHALQQGKGVLLLGGHYTTLEISGRLLAFHSTAIQPIYKPAHNILYNDLMVASRTRLFDGLLLNTDFRAILRALKHNKVVWYAPDQDFGREQTVFAPFMGIPAATLTMTSRLAKSSGAAVLPLYSQRLPGTQGFLIRVLPPLQDFPGGDDAADAARVNAVIEQQVREAPEQYLWLHRRFKTRPPGASKLYPKRNRRRRRRNPQT